MSTIPTTIKVGRYEYPVDASTGWCVELQAWVVRNADGKLVTIPANDQAF